MFKSKITFSVITFLIFLIITAIIKNETRTFEKKIYQLNKIISLKEKDLNDSQFDFYYLTSPVIIEKKIENLSYNNYFPMEYSKIFLNLSDFTNIQKKITTLKNLNAKEEKKN